MGQRFEGKSLEEALQSASEALGAERYQLIYHVVVERRGFLGGLKRIVIEASVNESAAPPPPAPPARERPPRDERAPRGDRPMQSSGRRDGGGRGGRDGGGRGRGRAGAPPERGRQQRQEPADDLPQFWEEEPQVEIPPQGEQSESARRVAEWCVRLFDLAHLEAAVRTEETDEALRVRLYGRDSRRFTHRDGELLDSVQVIVNKTLAHQIEKPIEFDCGSFKEDRVQAIGRKALEVAELVREAGREQLLPAMSPIERRIVHVTLQDAADVTTESRGEGFFKRVAIMPKQEERSAGS